MPHTLYRDGIEHLFDNWEDLENALGDLVYACDHEGRTYYHASAIAASHSRVSTVWTFSYRQAKIINARDYAAAVRQATPSRIAALESQPLKPKGGCRVGPVATYQDAPKSKGALAGK